LYRRDRSDDRLSRAAARAACDRSSRELRGRGATPAEIDRLAQWLLDEVGEVSIIAEERHEIDAHAEASVHQVRIEVAAEDVRAEERANIERRILERADHWARVCSAERHVDVR
jgi:hypothetical protein